MSRPLLVVFIASAWIATSAPAADPTWLVNSTADAHDAATGDGVCETSAPGICTLRAAVEQASASGGGIVLVPAGTYHLSLGELLVTKSTEIDGDGAGVTSIVGAAGSRILEVSSALVELSTTLFLRDLTLRDADILGSGAGGAVYGGVSTILTMERCDLINALFAGGSAPTCPGT